MKRGLFPAIVLVCAAPGGAQTLDLSSPKATVRSFVACVNRNDYRSATKCIRGASFDSGAAVYQAAWKQHKRTIVLKQVSMTVSGTRARADVAFAEALDGSGAPLASRDTLDLERDPDGWRIAAPKDGAAGTQPRSALSDTVAALLNRDVLGRALTQAHKTKCLVNVKRIGMAILERVHYGDETFDLSTKTMRKQLEHYADSPGIFACPDAQGAEEAYSFNDKLSGLTFGALKHPERTVLIYEGANGKLAYRHSGFAMVCYADGHAKAVSQPEAKDLIWKP